MRRRLLLVGGVLVAASARPASAQARRARIGVLATGTSASEDDLVARLKRALAERGYIEPDGVEFAVRFADGRLPRLAERARELAALRVDVIVTWNTSGVRAARDATATIPIVAAPGGDLVASNLVASLAQPGGNVTGLTALAPDLAVKQIEVLIELVPKLSRLAVLRWPAGGTGNQIAQSVEAAAARHRIAVSDHIFETPEQLPETFASIVAAGCEAVIVIDNAGARMARERIAALAAERRLPVISTSRDFVVAGATLAYSDDRAEMFRRAAGYVDRILKGAKPADLPIEQPTVFKLVVNLPAVRALGLSPSPLLIARADEVIE